MEALTEQERHEQGTLSRECVTTNLAMIAIRELLDEHEA